MRLTLWLSLLVATLWLAAIPAFAASGTISYTARVVHNNRKGLSYVAGSINVGNGSFSEEIQESYNLDWRHLPGKQSTTRPNLPDIYRAEGRMAYQQGQSLPSLDSPRLRHFLVGEVIGRIAELNQGDKFLADQLEILTLERSETGFELVADFRGMPLVVVGRLNRQGDRNLPGDFAVLGPSSELYQYFFTSQNYTPEASRQALKLPDYDPAHFVEFPEGEAAAIAIRPVKDWLVFQAYMPNGRPLNLVFDSGAERMILDEMVLKVDGLMEPVGEMPVAGALAMESMHLYEGFSFQAGGVTFKNLEVVGTSLMQLGIGAEARIHGIVGNEILQLCRLDIDLREGTMRLLPHGKREQPSGQELELTFIEKLPHVRADVNHSGGALLMLDTGMRSPLAVNLDWLDNHQLSDELKMNGFLGDVTGGLLPRYILENMNIELAGQNCVAKPVDAAPDATYNYDGLPVVGSIGFPMLASHFGGITFDYSRKRVYLREPGSELVFAGRPEAWAEQEAQQEQALLAMGWNTTAPGLTPRGQFSRAAADQSAQPASESIGPADEQAEGAAWAGNSFNLSDPLGLVRDIAPPVATDSEDAVHVDAQPPAELSDEELLATGLKHFAADLVSFGDQPGGVFNQAEPEQSAAPESKETGQERVSQADATGPWQPGWEKLPNVTERPDPAALLGREVADRLGAFASDMWRGLLDEPTETEEPVVEDAEATSGEAAPLFSEF